jgi:DNA-binding transcriptional LysR family regulator
MTFESNDMVRRLSARLKMRHLVLLLQIQQHGSLTRVAEHMASSQPAVTNALAELESMFGMPLFERSSRGMLPTALGSVVLERPGR